MTENVYKNRKLNIEKLMSFGFKKVDNKYIYHTDLLEGQLTLTVKIDGEGTIFTCVVDHNGDEYVLYRVAGAEGSFVGQVKSECESVLKKIYEDCFDPDVFKSEQAKFVIAYMKKTYGDEPEYLWHKFPDNAIVRRKDNQKWYAALLTIPQRKLGLDLDGTIEILDLRIKPEEMESTIDNIKFFPGYHMNKKHWITICLDGSVSNEKIYRKIDDSYHLARK